MSDQSAAQPEQPQEQQGAFLLNVNSVFATNVATYSLSFVGFLILARVLGPDGRGVISLFQAAVTLAFTFISLGISLAAIYYISKRDLRDRELLEHGLTVTIAALLLTTAGVAVLRLFFGDDLRAERIPYGLAIVAVPLLIQFRLVEGVLRGHGRFMAVNLMELAFPVVSIVGIVSVEVLVGLTVGRAITVWTVALALPLLLGYLFLGPSAWPRRPSVDANLPRVLVFGVQGQSGNLVQLLNYRLDSYLILLFVGKTGVGLYAVGVALSEGLWFIANSVAVVLIPRLTASDDRQAAETAPIIARNTLAITALAAIALAAVSPFLIPLFFGGDYRGSIAPFLWLLPGTVALAGGKILSTYVFSRGRPLINTWIAVVTLVVTLVLDLALIPPFGVSGAAIASSAAYIVSLALTALAFRRLSGRPVSEALVPRPSDLPLFVEGLRGLLSRLRPAASASPGVRSEP
jgi:O-antigen/teichoic acid export membrane protein